MTITAQGYGAEHPAGGPLICRFLVFEKQEVEAGSLEKTRFCTDSA
jgi:hypothetical protein